MTLKNASTDGVPKPSREELLSWRAAHWDGPFNEAKNRMCDALLAQEESFIPIGKLHRPSGRLTGGKGVTGLNFLQDVFSIPLPVHGTLRVYRKEGESAE